jgi:choline dehydrogenase-like flavoprotein
MFVDARTMPSGAVTSADVCVVGAGPIGMSVAQQLARSGLRVALLESGGLEQDAAANALGQVAEIDFGNVTDLGNTRQVGGNANAWQVRAGLGWRGVRLVPLSPVDFTERPGVADSGWPITFDSLEKYFLRAQDVFALPRIGYDAHAWAGGVTEGLVPDGRDMRSAVYQFGTGAVFVDDARKDLEASPLVTLYHHASALELLTDDAGGRVTGVRVASQPGREMTFSAGHVVVAAGCVTTTQLLLSSDRVQPGGLGNGNDLVGRYFMDHLMLTGGKLRPTSPAAFERMSLYDIRVVDGTPVMGHLQLSDDVIERESLLNLSMILLPRERHYERHQALSERQEAGVSGALALREALLRRTLPRREDVGHVFRGADGVVKRALDSTLFPKAKLGRGGWSQLPRKSRRFETFEVINQVEQAPHRDNRIMLSKDRNQLGARKFAVDWRWHDEDVAATMRAQEVFAREVRRAGWGELDIARVDGRPVVRSYSSSHFMGTTRMSADPGSGVVNESCAVHGVPNLFIAASSVFPTGGFANATLTTMALALRVADQVALLARRSPPSVSTAPMPPGSGE